MSNNDEFFKNFSRTVKVETFGPEPAKRKQISKLHFVFMVLTVAALVGVAVFIFGVSPYLFLAPAIMLPAVYFIDDLENKHKRS